MSGAHFSNACYSSAKVRHSHGWSRFTRDRAGQRFLAFASRSRESQRLQHVIAAKLPPEQLPRMIGAGAPVLNSMHPAPASRPETARSKGHFESAHILRRHICRHTETRICSLQQSNSRCVQQHQGFPSVACFCQGQAQSAT